ncbi:hypothetical protein BCF33_1661 [Hasllibacter halocynthiae]|uniref:DUF4177 domain-containing protein n=2 Tax=Hasllibacter halocynthiae TaxID=595589 RepID=A0A2T0X1L4_9RHOB|nr:hypothetical protein BCF33_1661 [Hasllibacter halocynthiae]
MSAPAFGQAPCYADYKARTVEPLRLHYGTIELHEACDASSAASEIAGRIARDGWQLLEVVGIFDADGLQEREADAGAYHLRY